MAEDSLPKIISAREAFEAGLTRYFTGKACKNGHVAERILSNGSCAECMKAHWKAYRERKRKRAHTRAYFKAWKKANPEKVAEYERRYTEKHPETRQKAIAKYRATHADEIRKRDRENKRRIRAINPEAEKARLERWKAKQEEKKLEIAGRPRAERCDICGSQEKTVFDHCHASQCFRGWLCDRCNRTLGQVKDDVTLLAKMIAYLEGHNGRTHDKSEEGTPEIRFCNARPTKMARS